MSKELKTDWGEADGYANHECPGCGRTSEGWAWQGYAPPMSCYGCGAGMDVVGVRPLKAVGSE